MLLDGKTALITGTARGIGRALAEVFAAEGALVIAHARKKTPEFALWLDDLCEKTGNAHHPLYFDLTDSTVMKSEMAVLFKEKLAPDILVNNAGMVPKSLLFAMTPMAQVHEVFETNFFAAMELTQLAVRGMMRKKAGAIVNITSVAALDGEPAQLEYVAAKAAMEGATKKLASELASTGIRVNAVAPGLIDTAMQGHMEESLHAQSLQRVLMQREGTPKEVARAAVFLASDAASYITGQTLRVDGGML